MSRREQYVPSNRTSAKIRKEGDKWILVLVRDLSHPPAKVWRALTEPEHLREWSPFDADRNLGVVGSAKLTTVGAPSLHVSETQVKRADAPKVLEMSFGGRDLRWELEPLDNGTRLTLWHNIDRGFIAMGAAGWHISLDVLDQFLSGEPIGRIVGAEAMRFDGWQKLNTAYTKQFELEPPAELQSTITSPAIENLNTAQKRAFALRPKVGGFPVLAEVLRQAGVQKNMWELPSAQSVYLTELGPIVQQGAPLISGIAAIPAFDELAVVRAIRADQAGETSFPEFLRAIWMAGVVHYEVDFALRTVTYSGVSAERYVETYPAALL